MSEAISIFDSTVRRLRTFWLRYAHVASLREHSSIGHWVLFVRPHDRASCPFRIMISRNGTFAFVAGPIAYDNVPLDASDYALEISMAVAEGRVERHDWRCPWSGLLRGREARIAPASMPELLFKGGHINPLLAPILPRAWCRQTTTRFTAYPVAENRLAVTNAPLPQNVFVAPPAYST